MVKGVVELDCSNLFSDRLGGLGLVRAEFDGWAGRLAELTRGIEARTVAGELDFRLLHRDMDFLGHSVELAKRLRVNTKNLLVLGIGGSALGTVAVDTALNPRLRNMLDDNEREGPRLFVCDNVDPTTLGELLDHLDPAETVINVISKSGGTAETLAQFMIFYGWLSDTLGRGEGAKRVVVTTDPEKGPLRRLAAEEGFASLEVPVGVGGRFSVLSPVGLFPLAMVGCDVSSLLEGATAMDARCSTLELHQNPAALYALAHYLYVERGRNISVMLPYSDRLRYVADWFAQLWAESLGKRLNLSGEEVNAGLTPVKSLGVTDQHSQVQLYMEGPHDKVVTFVEVADHGRSLKIPKVFGAYEETSYLEGRGVEELFGAELRGTRAALTKNARPNLTIRLERVDAFCLGQLIYLLEMATVYAGALMGIDPMDQPGVELGKKITFGLMGREGYDRYGEDVKKGEK